MEFTMILNNKEVDCQVEYTPASSGCYEYAPEPEYFEVSVYMDEALVDLTSKEHEIVIAEWKRLVERANESLVWEEISC